MRAYAAAFLGAAAALVLSGCGIRGDLERPPPLWGEDMRTEAEREHEGDIAPPDGPIDTTDPEPQDVPGEITDPAEPL
ncbi:MAG: lipoprotein [Oceanicaulis sp.]